MSRRDIAVILERLSLDHRTSLSEKACAYLQAVESNSSIKNHPSHAAICVNIAADQLSIEVSRSALIRTSGAASEATYTSSLQNLTRILTGNPLKNTDSLNLDDVINTNSRHAQIQQLITAPTLVYLRQLAVLYGSIELVDLVLECLERFSNTWVLSLPPAQRIHVRFSDAKWIGAGFWLCAMARHMTLGKDEVQDEAAGKVVAVKKSAKRIGGRGSKALKDRILTTLEHKIRMTELDNTIRLIEDHSHEYLTSLKKTKKGQSSAISALVSTSTSRKRKTSDSSNSSSATNIVIPVRGKGEGWKPTTQGAGGEEAKAGTSSRSSDTYRRLGTKRQISNVSQMSVNSDIDEPEHEVSTPPIAGSPKSAKPPSKRSKLESQGSSLSSADIMGTSKGAVRKGLKETTAASQESSRLLNLRRNTGGVYSMIPRGDMETTMSQPGPSKETPASTFLIQGKTHLMLWSLAEEYIEQARSLCFIAATQPNSQPGWRKRHRDLIFCAIKCLVACVSTDSLPMTQLDKAKSGLRLAQILFEETESLERCEEEVNKAIQGSSALDIQLRLYELQIQIQIEMKKFRLAKNTIRIASTLATKQGFYWWTYQFYLLKARMHFLTNDLPGSLTTLNQGAMLADQRGDFDLKMAFWIVAGQYSLMLSNWDQAMAYLQKLAPHMGLDESMNLQSSSAPSSAKDSPQSLSPITLNSPGLQTGKVCQSKQLRVFFLILYISCMLRSGSTAKSLSALATLHSALDETRPKDTEELQGVFRIPVKPQQDQHYHHHLQHNQGNELPQNSPKADMTQTMKSQQFLVEGIKVVDRELSVNDFASSTLYVRRNQRWYSLLMMSMLLHLSDVLLLKFDLVSAEETILKATYWSKVCGMWEVFKWRISLTIGMTMQLGGQLEEALNWYGICQSHSEERHRDPEGYEAKTLAIINTALIYCGESFQDFPKAKELQLEARARHASGMSVNILCALHILDSRTKEGLMPARQHLQEALKLSTALVNSQLRSLTLLLLGNVYLQTHDEQAEKMLMAGHMYAVKTSNQIIAAATGACLKDLYLATSQGIKASQQTNQNIPILEQVDKVFHTSPFGSLLPEIE
ncbi:hypothetical protein BGZ76_003154 [Entomortierella beljakovae]|nr:hypothetical protein BGZ76_003154 [Entomortierella beljakovae]